MTSPVELPSPAQELHQIEGKIAGIRRRTITSRLLAVGLAALATFGTKEVLFDHIGASDRISTIDTVLPGVNIAIELAQDPNNRVEITLNSYSGEVKQIFDGTDPKAPEKVLDIYSGNAEDGSTIHTQIEQAGQELERAETREQEVQTLAELEQELNDERASSQNEVRFDWLALSGSAIAFAGSVVMVLYYPTIEKYKRIRLESKRDRLKLTEQIRLAS